MTFDGKAFGQEIVGAVKSHVADVLRPILSRLDAMEKQIEAIPAQVSVDLSPYAQKSEIDGVKAAIVEALAKVEADNDLPARIDALEKGLAAIPAPSPSVDLSPIEASIAEIRAWGEGIEKTIAELPEPVNGIDGKDGADGAPGERGPAGEPGKDGERGEKGEPGREGLGVKELLIDRDGRLVATMTDGDVRAIGPVVGKDADMTAIETRIKEMVEAIPKPRDGVDGVGFDDMTCEVREDGVYLVFEKGEIVKEARLPVPIDRGVYKEGKTYRHGDGVSYAGSFWIAQEDAEGKPDIGKGWRLAVKRGRDGKDAVAKTDKPKEPVRV